MVWPYVLSVVFSTHCIVEEAAKRGSIRPSDASSSVAARGRF